MTSEYKSKIRAMSLFAEFTDDELESLFELLDPVHVKAGDCIVQQDEPGYAMFIIVSGAVSVVHCQNDERLILADLGPGDFFGELALVDHGPRSADVEAVTGCDLVAFSQGAVNSLAGVHPSAAFKLLVAVGRVLVKRLRAGNRKYIDSLLTGKQ